MEILNVIVGKTSSAGSYDFFGAFPYPPFLLTKM